MTDDEQRLYELLRYQANTPETLPQALGISAVSVPVQHYAGGGGLPDLAAYLGLHGDFLGGHYQIDPKRPEGFEVPVHLKYTRPLYGGEFKADADLSPTERSLQLHYHRDF
jgi:hypothetical protein